MSQYDYDPSEEHRPPREEGWKKETEQIIFQLRNRGDQRIGQQILNAIRNEYDDELPSPKEMVDYDKDLEDMSDEEMSDYLDRISQAEAARKAKVENILWNMEAPELLEALKNRAEKVNSSE